MTTPLHLFENHDEAYHIWRRAGLTGKTLVHLDAHAAIASRPADHQRPWQGSRPDVCKGEQISGRERFSPSPFRSPFDARI